MRNGGPELTSVSIKEIENHEKFAGYVSFHGSNGIYVRMQEYQGTGEGGKGNVPSIPMRRGLKPVGCNRVHMARAAIGTSTRIEDFVYLES